MDIKIFTNNIEDSATTQINTLAGMDIFSKETIRIMPDVHAGAGCVIGFTSTYHEAIIPNIVGVDIGCGMRVVNYGKLVVDDNFLSQFDAYIKSNIPSGFAVNDKPDPFGFNGLYCYSELRNIERLERSIGTLGGGNHFIELDKDDEGNIYLVIHTGSRNLGKQVADFYQKKAKERHLINVPEGLEYLDGEDMKAYLHDMIICISYARVNRNVIASKCFSFICEYYNDHTLPRDEFESIHNYIDTDNRIIRKGAISASSGKKVIIPLNMRDGSIIGVGKGNHNWNDSAPHGAGRIMSRGEARRRFKLFDIEASMKGIYTTTATELTIDEAPGAYKPAKEIIDAISDTVSIEELIRPIYNFKAAE